MRVVDTHAHLNFADFDKDRDQVLASLADSQIGTINVATDFSSVEPIDQLTKNNPLVWGTVGLHPQDMTAEALLRLPKEIDHWQELMSANGKLVAVGEIGLDYYRLDDAQQGASTAEQQKAGLRQLLTFAAEVKKPVIFHCRDAYGDLQTIVADYPGIRGVVHCFCGTFEQARAFLDLGMFLSFTAMLTYPKNDELRAVVKEVPLEKIMIETDSPFLAPQAIRGTRNDPRQVVAVAEAIAEIKNISVEAVLEQTTRNASEFFGLSATPE